MSGKASCPRIGPAMSARKKQISVNRPPAVVCRSPHERSDMRVRYVRKASPGYRFAHPGYACYKPRKSTSTVNTTYAMVRTSNTRDTGFPSGQTRSVCRRSCSNKEIARDDDPKKVIPRHEERRRAYII